MRPKPLIGAAIASLILSAPIAYALHQSDIKLKLQTTQTQTLQSRLKLDQKKAADLLRAKEAEQEQLKLQNDDLKNQLQSKKEAAQVVASTVVVPPAPVVQPQVAPILPTGSAKAFIYQHESGNNPGSINPTSGACGLGQALPCSKMPCSLSDYACQDNFFTGYMLSRYGSWEAARSWWLSHSWW